jgi:HD-like signal output (HDOD) protein
MDDKKRILFVDDEPAILAGLQNLLFKDRKRWDMVFTSSGQDALSEIRKQPFDIVVSDMRMPGVDGATLLNTVKDHWPETVRIMLSGQADRDAIVRALPALHQLLSKPCNVETLRTAIERSLGGADVDRDNRIRKIVGGVDKLPTPPDIYFHLTRLTQAPTTNVAEVTKVVTRDPGLSAKLLQLVNSAYFGAGHTTTSIQQAVMRLGTDRLRYLALTAAVFTPVKTHHACWFSLDDLQRGALRAAVAARDFAEPAGRDEAFASTLLHDVGHIVLALGSAPEFQQFHERAAKAESLCELELELFGATHAELGARLLAIWGLPNAIVDAVHYHHDPGSAPESCRRLASIVHVADAAVAHLPIANHLNMPSLARAGCAHLVQGWLALAGCASAGAAAAGS